MEMIYERVENLCEAVEAGRRYKIAAEVFEEFLSNRKAEIIREFEEKYLDDGSIYDNLADLRAMRKFRDVCAKMISLGEIAEGELARNGE